MQVAPEPDASTPLATWLRQACHLEALARKPGNVHPQASFTDLTFEDLVRAADCTAPVLARAAELGVGPTILAAAQATRAVCGGNPNLGIILLLAPLAAVPRQETLEAGIGPVLEQLTIDDARLAYEAIRLAKPGGLGQVSQSDVSQVPTETLLVAMRRAAPRDLVAAQYADRFHVVLQVALPLLEQDPDFPEHAERAIIRLHLELMSRFGDSLIARKCGSEVAAEAARQARVILDGDWPATEESCTSLREFDAWLRADGHRRNPGTTADLIAATLFAGFREARLPRPQMPFG